MTITMTTKPSTQQNEQRNVLGVASVAYPFDRDRTPVMSNRSIKNTDKNSNIKQNNNHKQECDFLEMCVIS